uniref:Uncharacterized protein n=1 Tax=Arundo donax TaxID=35708 RepID=A0A0A9F8U1_ARUDO
MLTHRFGIASCVCMSGLVFVSSVEKTLFIKLFITTSRILRIAVTCPLQHHRSTMGAN